MTIPWQYSVRSLLQRKSRSLLTALGIGAVVAIFVAMTALGRGMAASFASTGSADNVVVLQRGAFSQSLSSLPRHSRDVVRYVPHLRSKAGEPLVSPELAIEPWVRTPGREEEVFTVARGVDPVFFDVEDTVHLLEGSAALRGNRLLVGRTARARLGGPRVGDSLGMFGEEWTVSGIFEAGGTGLEGIVLADLTDLMRAAKRDEYTSFTLKLDDPASADEAIRLLEADRRVVLSASRERDYYADAGKTFSIVGRLGLLISLIVTLGAVFGGMNTMYTAVSGRMREVGTLRALGFRRSSILRSFLLESLLLSVSGGALGVAVGSLVNGLSLNVMTASVRFSVGAGSLAAGLALSVLVGLAGGFLPAHAAARTGIVDAMRAR